MHSVKFFFVQAQKGFEEAISALKFLGRLKKLGPAQNILGLVKGQASISSNP